MSENTANIGFEKEIWDAACILRGNMDAAELHSMLLAWSEQAEKLENGEISREEYDRWRYRYPEFDTTQHWVKVPSKRFSDMMVKAFKDKLKD